MSQKTLLNEVREKYENAYRKQTPKSRTALEAAREYLPGGETRGAQWFSPYPIWSEKADGCRLTDIDGNDYIDFHNCATAMVLGHGNPKVKAAVLEQLEKGPTAMGAIAPKIIQWAEMICQRVESVDKVRFTNSGTEGMMMAIRGVRAFTGKDKILKAEGAYHGFYDPIVYPSDTTGLPKSVLGDSITFAYNDEESLERAVIENKNQLAAVILEGQLGSAGQISPKEGYFKFIREVTAAHNVLLILDEIQTLRLDYGGMQHIHGIKPDLTALGKMIGGGTPVGAFGGREDIMQQFSPEVRKVYHSGTFNANPVTVAAGIATLEQLTAEEIARINKLGESLAEGIRNVFAKLNIKGQVAGSGSLRCLHFSTIPVIDGKTALQANKDMLHLLHLALLQRGIFLHRTCLLAISTPMTEKEIDFAVRAVDDSMTELKPYIGEIWPELVVTV